MTRSWRHACPVASSCETGTSSATYGRASGPQRGRDRRHVAPPLSVAVSLTCGESRAPACAAGHYGRRCRQPASPSASPPWSPCSASPPPASRRCCDSSTGWAPTCSPSPRDRPSGAMTPSCPRRRPARSAGSARSRRRRRPLTSTPPCTAATASRAPRPAASPCGLRRSTWPPRSVPPSPAAPSSTTPPPATRRWCSARRRRAPRDQPGRRPGRGLAGPRVVHHGRHPRPCGARPRGRPLGAHRLSGGGPGIRHRAVTDHGVRPNRPRVGRGRARGPQRHCKTPTSPRRWR